MSKKVFGLLGLLTVASLVLAACGPAPATEPPATEAPEAPGTEAPEAFECMDAIGCVEVAAGDPIRIASALVISGPNASLGLDSQYGVEIAIQFKGDVLGHPVELQAEDDGCNAEGGQAAGQPWGKGIHAWKGAPLNGANHQVAEEPELGRPLVGCRPGARRGHDEEDALAQALRLAAEAHRAPAGEGLVDALAVEADHPRLIAPQLRSQGLCAGPHLRARQVRRGSRGPVDDVREADVDLEDAAVLGVGPGRRRQSRFEHQGPEVVAGPGVVVAGLGGADAGVKPDDGELEADSQVVGDGLGSSHTG